MMADASLQTGPKELDPASLGLAIRERRKAARMTQEVTASLCGISKKTLIKIEKGGDVYLSTLLQVMKARPRPASARLPVAFFLRRSTSIRWLSVPPETTS